MSSIDPTSKKRFHRKGFTGHVVNDPKFKGPIYPPNLTNHLRHVYRRERRKELAAEGVK